MKKILIGLVAMALIFAPAASAVAATDTANLNVSATVIGNARITSVGNVAFGNYDPTESTTALDANGSVTVRATKSLPYTVYIGAARTMSDGTNTLNYQLYSDAARTSAWGSTLATGQAYTSASNAESAKTIYGRIAVLQDVPAGNYSGTVTITLEF